MISYSRYSTIWFARALPDDGEVTTLELLEHHAKVLPPIVNAWTGPIYLCTRVNQSRLQPKI